MSSGLSLPKPAPDVDPNVGRDPRKCACRRLKGYEHLPYEMRPFACNKWALVGLRYCKLHNHGNMSELKGVGRMPRIYKFISRTLVDRVSAYEEMNEEQISLKEEVNLYRASAEDAIEMYGMALDTREAIRAKLEETPDDEALREKLGKLNELVDRAASSMRDVLGEVRSAVLDAAKVETMIGGRFSMSTVKSIIAQCAQLMYQVCGDDHPEIAAEFERKLHERVKVAEVVSGTSLTPDMDVLDMDDTIPRLEQSIGD